MSKLKIPPHKPQEGVTDRLTRQRKKLNDMMKDFREIPYNTSDLINFTLFARFTRQRRTCRTFSLKPRTILERTHRIEFDGTDGGYVLRNPLAFVCVQQQSVAGRCMRKMRYRV